MTWFKACDSYPDQQSALLIGHLRCRDWSCATTITIRYISKAGLIADQTFVEASPLILYLTVRDCRPIPCHPAHIKHGWLIVPFVMDVDLDTIFHPKRFTPAYIPQVAERPWRPAIRTSVVPDELQELGQLHGASEANRC